MSLPLAIKQKINIRLIHAALSKGAKVYGSISGGKDGQAMANYLHALYIPITGFIHADLGRTEWVESMSMCHKISAKFEADLHIIKRSDNRDMIDHWQARLEKLRGTGKPFWSSAKERYCTSDMKRDPIDKFLRNCGHGLIISAEGIRANESDKRASKQPLTIRTRITSPYYDGMTVEEAIKHYHPAHRLALTWYPVFHFTLADVWATEGLSIDDLNFARHIYKQMKVVPYWWTFHPAYVYGNDRVSCMLCILGSLNDLQVGAEHNPTLLKIMIAMEKDGNATFKNNFSLEQLLTI